MSTHVPVEEVEVKVSDAEVLESVGNGKGNVLRVVVELEKLGGDPELLAGDTALGDTLTDLGLVAYHVSIVRKSFNCPLRTVGPRAVDVAATGLDVVLDGLGDLALAVACELENRKRRCDKRNLRRLPLCV